MNSVAHMEVRVRCLWICVVLSELNSTQASGDFPTKHIFQMLLTEGRNEKSLGRRNSEDEAIERKCERCRSHVFLLLVVNILGIITRLFEM